MRYEVYSGQATVQKHSQWDKIEDAKFVASTLYQAEWKITLKLGRGGEFYSPAEIFILDSVTNKIIDFDTTT